MEAQGMVEKIARAIAEAGDLDVDCLHYYYDQRPESFNEIARIAIEAMRTPSKAMLDAVEAEEEKRGYVAAAYESMDVETAWPIMIDAALAEDTACPASSKSRTGHRTD